ncbi:MAG TPA: bifunctional phosphoribosylaminoimidazolecarboxamide formyltransferase/IMP cyclohydrolase [Armatimonadota bacterium]|jgi:phosphoribosylaminoimidazolecarboxamide formyltransferase/IMP cyclohydrolase
MPKIKLALLSVSDKTGLVDFARGLRAMDVKILSTGGTKRSLEEAGIEVTAVEDYTGFPEMMEGRVKTLHPKVHGGLLARRDNEEHMAQAAAHGIEMIDLVVVNLYPFQQTVAKPDVTLEDAVENIDIGGPTMLRSAAKNFASVAVVCNPSWYDRILEEMRASDGEVSAETRRQLALEVFAHTGQYDAAITSYLSPAFAAEPTRFPQYFAPWYAKQGEDLRYGENPHQAAALYAQINAPEPGLAHAEKLWGERELSFNNYLDLTAALEAARDFEEPTAIIVKHLTPCGAATAATLREAFETAWAVDPISAFGGVIGLNRVVDKATAEIIGNNAYLQETIAPRYREESGDADSNIISAFVEAIIAPGYEPEALELLKRRKNLRVMLLEDFCPEGRKRDLDLKKIPGGLVVQTPDLAFATAADLKVVTKKQPTPEQIASLLFADRLAKHVKSNAIVLVQGTRLVGCGAGQMSRFDSCVIAARKAGKRASGACLASDAMFPARDGLDAAAATGAVAILQPGGSKADAEVIAAADEAGIAMVFSGMRHFWH